MTDTEINIAIAEFCEVETWQGDCPDKSLTKEGRSLPSYTTDLNAMWEAEEKLDIYLMRGYQEWLIRGINTMFGTGGPECHARFVIHATARQRAEALLKTIGKWTE